MIELSYIYYCESPLTEYGGTYVAFFVQGHGQGSKCPCGSGRLQHSISVVQLTTITVAESTVVRFIFANFLNHFDLLINNHHWLPVKIKPSNYTQHSRTSLVTVRRIVHKLEKYTRWTKWQEVCDNAQTAPMLVSVNTTVICCVAVVEQSDKIIHYVSISVQRES